ncbi:MAG: porin [Pararobbsia sp.]
MARVISTAGVAATCTLVLLLSGRAWAQSDVNLQGVIDGGVTYVNGQHGGAATLFDSGILTPDTLTFKGSEDLGGGNRTLFELTSQFDLGSGGDHSRRRPDLRSYSPGWPVE